MYCDNSSPKIYKNCLNSVIKSKFKQNTHWLNKSSFNAITGKSFDYAILEKAKNISGIKLNIPWSDLGNWKEILKVYLYFVLYTHDKYISSSVERHQV